MLFTKSLIEGKQIMTKLTVSLVLGLLLVLNLTSIYAQDELSSTKSHIILIKGFEFVPNVLEVSVGDTVTWKNKDYVPHSIENTTQLVKPSLSLDEGDTYSVTIKDGFNYKCGLHPSMKGRIIVLDNSEDY